MNLAGILDALYLISAWAVPVLLAVTLHEAAHGWAACRLGDDTALRLGRVTFNPIRHIDPFGTFILPIMLLLASGGQMMFGFARPVPVNFMRLRRPRRDMVLVALAGPLTNITMAVAAAAMFHTLPFVTGAFREWMQVSLYGAVLINLVLAVFNMLPIPPLDGGRVAVGLLPRVLARPLARLERAGILIILGGVFLVPFVGDALGQDWNVFAWLIGVPASALEEAIFRLVGVIG